MVHVIYVRKLQQHLSVLTKIAQAAPPRKSRLFEGKSLAAGLVSQGLRLLPTLHEGAEAGDEHEQEKLPL